MIKRSCPIASQGTLVKFLLLSTLFWQFVCIKHGSPWLNFFSLEGSSTISIALKFDVETGLPPKKETILKVGMLELQK